MKRQISLLLLLLWKCNTILGQEKLIWPFYTNAESTIDIYNDLVFSARDNNEENNDLFLEAKFNFYTYFTNSIYLYNSFNIEAVKDPEYGKSNYFGNIGLFWNNLNLNYENDHILIGVGRGSPNFSIGWAVGPGIWGSDDSFENLKTGGKWGIIVAPNFSLGSFGSMSINVGLFTADNSTLSDSYITRRGIFYREYGGPSNTGKLDSYSISISGSSIPKAPNLYYHFGYMNQKVVGLNPDLSNPISKDSLDNEQRFVAAAFYTFEISEETNLIPFIEYGHIVNSLGIIDNEKTVFTSSLEYNINNWSHSISYSNVNSSLFDSYYNISYSAGYTFDSGMEVSAGYKYSNNSSHDYTNMLGASFSYAMSGRNSILLGSDFAALNHKKQLIYIRRFMKTHKSFRDYFTDEDKEEAIISKLIEYLKNHPNALNRPVQISLTNILVN